MVCPAPPSVVPMVSRRGRAGARSMDELIRLACSTDPEVPVSRPRRAALAPRAAMAGGVLLLLLALVLAVRTMASAPDGAQAPVDGSSADPAHAASQEAGAARTDSGADGLPGTGATPGAGLAPTDPLTPGGGNGGAGAGNVVVHVAGAVATPGVVTLPAGSRVADAVAAAGGDLAEADTGLINLARVLADGEQVRVPFQGEEVPADQAVGTSSGSGAGSGTGGAGGGGAGGLVNVNTADASTLETLPGIGPALAQRIVEHREQNGPFASVEDLTDVPGIGPAKLEALREAATV